MTNQQMAERAARIAREKEENAWRDEEIKQEVDMKLSICLNCISSACLKCEDYNEYKSKSSENN